MGETCASPHLHLAHSYIPPVDIPWARSCIHLAHSFRQVAVAVRASKQIQSGGKTVRIVMRAVVGASTGQATQDASATASFSHPRPATTATATSTRAALPAKRGTARTRKKAWARAGTALTASTWIRTPSLMRARSTVGAIPVQRIGIVTMLYVNARSNFTFWSFCVLTYTWEAKLSL